MAKLNPEERRKAALEAKNKSRANEQLVTLGSTVESVIQTEQNAKPATKQTEKQGPGRPTTADNETRNYTFRLTKQESRKIDELVFFGKVESRSDFVRKALKLMCED